MQSMLKLSAEEYIMSPNMEMCFHSNVDVLTQEENFSQSRIFSRFISTENYDLIFVLLLMFVANMLTVTSTSN